MLKKLFIVYNARTEKNLEMKRFNETNKKGENKIATFC